MKISLFGVTKKPKQINLHLLAKTKMIEGRNAVSKSHASKARSGKVFIGEQFSFSLSF
jgi:hypothetical protein